MDSKYLLSDNPQTVARALNKAVEEDLRSKEKEKARTGQRYYDYQHDILDNRIFYVDDNGVVQEDRSASNVKIPHPFFTELVDQKVQYLLSNPVEVNLKEDSKDEQFLEYLKEYYDDDFQLFLQEAVEGASVKGFEDIYARTNSDDRLCFQVADSLHTFLVYDETNQPVRLFRYYDKDIYRDGKNTTVKVAEMWDKEQVWYFLTDKNGRFTLDETREMNPRPHVVARTSDGKLLKRNYGVLPFYRLYNNKKGKTDLEPIKPLIDDYDLMACFLSNNLQDFSEAIYVVKGFMGDDLTKLRQNVKAKKTVGVGTEGDLDIKTVDIPVDARKTKLQIDKEAIYKFGMGFDSTQIADSNGSVTNVAIQSGYALLNMKANKMEVRMRAMLQWINAMIVQDINRRHNTAYKVDDIEITINRETVVNREENANIDQIEALARKTIVESILLVAPRLDDESVLKLICEQFELNWEEVQLLLEQEDYTPGLQDETDPPLEGDVNAAIGQVAAGAATAI